MDVFTIFNHDSNQTRFIIPEYLYDSNLLNDVQYIFNKDIFCDYTVLNIGYLVKGVKKDNDLAYNWNSSRKFDKKEVLKSYGTPKKRSKLPEDYFMTQYEANMENITEYIERYPKSTFKIFFPPYSILAYDNSQIDAQIAVTKKVMEDLLNYENVELYYFQNIEDIITNLDNYKDYTHYKEEINYYMYECMCKTNEHRISSYNYLNEIEKMKNIVINYDYDKLFRDR